MRPLRGQWGWWGLISVGVPPYAMLFDPVGVGYAPTGQFPPTLCYSTPLGSGYAPKGQYNLTQGLAPVGGDSNHPNAPVRGS